MSDEVIDLTGDKRIIKTGKLDENDNNIYSFKHLRHNYRNSEPDLSGLPIQSLVRQARRDLDQLFQQTLHEYGYQVISTALSQMIQLQPIAIQQSQSPIHEYGRQVIPPAMPQILQSEPAVIQQRHNQCMVEICLSQVRF